MKNFILFFYDCKNQSIKWNVLLKYFFYATILIACLLVVFLSIKNQYSQWLKPEVIGAISGAIIAALSGVFAAVTFDKKRRKIQLESQRLSVLSYFAVILKIQMLHLNRIALEDNENVYILIDSYLNTDYADKLSSALVTLHQAENLTYDEKKDIMFHVAGLIMRIKGIETMYNEYMKVKNAFPGNMSEFIKTISAIPDNPADKVRRSLLSCFVMHKKATSDAIKIIETILGFEVAMPQN